MELNQIKEFNKLFEAINNQGSTSYFSGPRFIGIIREFDPNFADYGQYISYREKEGLSPSRKHYYYDILMDFPENTRKKIIERIWSEVNNSNNQIDAQNEESIELFEEQLPLIEQQEPKATTEVIENPRVFISYSWDNEHHKNWIRRLADKLFENGVEVILDQYGLSPGKSIPYFMDESIKRADKVIIIFTPNYKLKAEKREGGTGYEYAILNHELFKTITTNSKHIPVLKEGTIETAIPEFMQQFSFIQMTDNNLFERKFNDLLLTIYEKPIIEKPKIGKRPDFR
jgi:hypothetical protein